ncbi:putative bifunctional diguanylate cyclase/phosphodiesterase [Silvibacterium acidisoli]|uniref:putative bifunctional diguanylate cyclase/phosphodiesterase n=1 Tax=Acidobacteriaceae bacterium ZG23-2 TaxID=2883246 RepID=UPI00406C3ED4
MQRRAIESFGTSSLASGYLAKSFHRGRRGPQRVADLEAANMQHAAILDSAALAIITTDLDGSILSANRETERLLGYSTQDLIENRNLAIFHDSFELEQQARILSRELSTTIRPGLEAILARARRSRQDEREWNYVRKDGTRFPVRLTISQLFNPDGGEEGFLAIAQDLSEQKRVEARMQHLAYHDALTNLPNRAFLHEQVTRSLAWARSQNRKVSLAVLDLDRFKHINDTLGHPVGDKVLIEIARRLAISVRQADTVARFGGDEFVILMPGVDDPEQSSEIMQRIRKTLEEPIMVGSHELYTTPSIGISSFPADGNDLETLLRKADRAMYWAKEHGRNTVETYDESMDRNAAAMLEMENSMRRALQREEFFLVYQPIFSIATGRVTGVEALLRWKQKTGKTIPPMDFVPLAEETGMILPIGEWVLRTACRDARKFIETAGCPLRLSVNVSPRQFKAPALFGLIADLLATHNIEPHDLQLEITEGVLLDERDGTAATVAGLRAIGVQVAIDDFGTGYSSLGYLRRFPIDRLKIDRSFVSDVAQTEEDTALAAAIISIGHTLRLKVTAEGVETAEQLEYLRTRDCDEAQGYYFAKPMSFEDLTKFLIDRRQMVC